ncbi:MAG: hypothetical protein ACFFCQ_01855 [Promethearchaeota archaeon]
MIGVITLLTALLMLSEGQERPQIIAGFREFDDLLDDIKLTRLTNRLLFKIGLGQERPQMELAGPITDEAFPDCKILFFSLLLQDPDADDPRVRESGAFSAIFLVFPSQKMSEILQAYPVLSRSLKAFIAEIKTIKDLMERAHALEGIVYKSLLRSALNQILDELMLDRAFKDVFVIAQDGTSLAVASRSRSKEEEQVQAKQAGAVSALSISERILETIDERDQNPIFIGQARNETIIALRMENGGIVAFLERRAVTFRGKEVFIDALRKASSKVSTLLQRETKGVDLFSVIQEIIPEVQLLLLSNTEGVTLAFENLTGNPDELSSITSVLFSTLVISGHDPKEIGVLEGKDNYVLLGKLRKDTILLITVPKKRKLDEYIFQMQEFLQIEKKQLLETLIS